MVVGRVRTPTPPLAPSHQVDDPLLLALPLILGLICLKARVALAILVVEWFRETDVFAKIYKPARSAMQSGQAKTHEWLLEFAPEGGKVLDPLMGWTGSADMNGQVQLRFENKEAAAAYAERNGIAYAVFEPTPRSHVLRQNGYGDNFAFHRRAAWTH